MHRNREYEICGYRGGYVGKRGGLYRKMNGVRLGEGYGVSLVTTYAPGHNH